MTPEVRSAQALLRFREFVVDEMSLAIRREASMDALALTADWMSIRSRAFVSFKSLHYGPTGSIIRIEIERLALEIARCATSRLT